MSLVPLVAVIALTAMFIVLDPALHGGDSAIGARPGGDLPTAPDFPTARASPWS